MLWYKAWLETRWRFLIGLALLICSAGATVLAYPQVLKLMPLVPTVDATTALGRRIEESAELARDYRGYVWSQWFRQNMTQLWTIFAALLGAGGLLAHGSGSGALFTLSMPASRFRLLGVRAAAGLAELLALAFVPSLVLPVLSPAIGQTYSLGDALIHSACLFIAGMVFFSLAFLLSTIFADLWRPLLLALLVAGVLGGGAQALHALARYDVFRVMSAERYFQTGRLPWLGLLSTVAASVAMLYLAVVNTARRDF